ncbi:hypothetical protein [Pyrococcus kukulkanii]|uniref:hypothetical protein n=1 Tax=Pyrococcus kukulkanii TaxID=1609559 RepID=UPI0035699D20
MSKRSVEEILNIFRKYDIDLEDVCKVIVYWYEPFSIFDGTPVGRLKDAAKEVLEVLKNE